MSFSMPLAPCDASTDANGVTSRKSHVSPLFDHCDPINAMVPLTTASTHCFTYCLDMSRHIDMFSHCVDIV